MEDMNLPNGRTLTMKCI